MRALDSLKRRVEKIETNRKNEEEHLTLVVACADGKVRRANVEEFVKRKGNISRMRVIRGGNLKELDMLLSLLPTNNGGRDRGG